MAVTRTKFQSIEFRGDYFAGKFQLSGDPDFSYEGKSPADKSDLVMKVSCNYSAAEEACRAAGNARDYWARTTYRDRRAFILRFLELLSRDAVELRQRISRETGKPLWEAAMELEATQRRTRVVIEEFDRDGWDQDIVLGNGRLEGAYRAKPRGAMLVLSHFNRPLENPLTYIIPGLLAGNTVVLKPSKKTPAMGQYLAEAFHEVGAAPGVFNLVHGGREMARRLAQQSDIDTIFYAGDYEFSKLLRRDTFDDSEKLLVMETGGKNPAIVFEDADQDLAVREILISAFQTAGQQAQSTSRLILLESVAESFIERLHEAAKNIQVGYPFDEANPPFMGPLVDRKTTDRYITFQGTAVREQAECVMRGKTLQLGHDGFYVSPSIYLYKNNEAKKIKDSTYLQTEIFGPSLGIHVVKSTEEAMAVANINNYGLCASVFTQSADRYQELWHGLRYGAIYWNCGTLRNLGNFRISGIRRSFKASPLVKTLSGYVTYPVASVENQDGGAEPEMIPPGLGLEK